MYLFIDTEFSDIPETWYNNSPGGPRLVQLSWILTDAGRNRLARGNHMIKPMTPVTARAAAVHGITTEMAIDKGDRLEKVLDRFNEAVDQARLIIGYNIRLDEMVIKAELSRTGIESKFPVTRKSCLIESYKKACGNNLAKSMGSLTLGSISQQLFNHASNELTDVELIEKCFFHDIFWLSGTIFLG